MDALDERLIETVSEREPGEDLLHLQGDVELTHALDAGFVFRIILPEGAFARIAFKRKKATGSRFQ